MKEGAVSSGRKLLMAYELYGISVILGAFLYMIYIWISSAMIGAKTGDYAFAINPNGAGWELYYELEVLVSALPAGLYLFGRAVVRIVRGVP